MVWAAGTFVKGSTEDGKSSKGELMLPSPLIVTCISLLATVGCASLLIMGLSARHVMERRGSRHLLATSSMASSTPLSPAPPCEKGLFQSSVRRVGPLRPPWTGGAARCSVQGLPIEELAPEANFRPRYAMRLTDDVEDKTHLLPWLLAAKKDFSAARRKIYVDFGGKTFNSSVTWFMHTYPLEFDEVHVFEAVPGVFQVPAPSRRGFQKTELLRVHLREGVFVGHQDTVIGWGHGMRKYMNATHWILEELKAAPEDALIIKMDIETAEWPLLRHWAQSPVMGQLVDELFVEVHYGHPSMERFGWMWRTEHNQESRENATRLLHDLRANGIYAHAWP